MVNARQSGLNAYIAVTAAYWAFMLTDGALRMLILLHFHGLGFTPVQLAFLFVLYEIAGVVTNLSAGWIAARFGLTKTLYAGLALQIIALLALTKLDPSWGLGLSVLFVMLVQGLSGVAKDLAKTTSKSAVKLLAPAQGGGLFRWVAVLTGSKNAVKGLGFFVGAALLASLGFNAALYAMAAVLALILGAVIIGMPSGLAGGTKGVKFKEVLSSDRRINWLSGARMFLFGARDVWFVVGLPIYFKTALSDGTPEGARSAFFIVGGFMALWIILYGAVQAFAPRILGGASQSIEIMTQKAALWAGLLAAVTLTLTLLCLLLQGAALFWCLVIGLLLFGFVFAVNSSLHSYLILAFSDAKRISLDVGFYYMANAAGRLAGTLLSGLSYQFGGLGLCLLVSALMALAAMAMSYGLRKAV